MSNTPDLETRILDELRISENRTKTLCPKDFNASANSFGIVLDLMVKREKICPPPGITLGFSQEVKNVDTEVEITMYPGVQ
jgi:hypothetical protein